MPDKPSYGYCFLSLRYAGSTRVCHRFLNHQGPHETSDPDGYLDGGKVIRWTGNSGATDNYWLESVG